MMMSGIQLRASEARVFELNGTYCKSYKDYSGFPGYQSYKVFELNENLSKVYQVELSEL